MSKKNDSNIVEVNKLTESGFIGDSKITVSVDNVTALKKAVSRKKYFNVQVLKLDLTSIDKEQKLEVPFILKVENKNLDASNPKGSKSSIKKY